jgi:RES domain-containing protein
MTLDDTSRARDWRKDPPPSPTAAIGDQWIIGRTSLALTVPSTQIPQQRNISLDPTHPEFEAIVDSMTTEPYVFDSRLAKH